MFDDKITVVLLRAAYVQGDPHPEGTKLRLSPPMAWEAVYSDGYAMFADPADAQRARDAFVQEQTLMLKRLNGSNPWQYMTRR